jgi:hypothetical protein
MTEPYQIAVYYFPNYHPDARNAITHGPGWTEWELVKRAEPRFPGHRQPRLPVWGYEDESDPQVMAKKIDTAADHGVNAFIFDWYWYNDGPFLERGLEEGFLNAPNNQRLKFALMWANHDWIDIPPVRLRECQERDYRLLYPGQINRQAFDTAVDHMIEYYFSHDSYWKINGAPYLSFYDLPALISSFGSFAATAEALASIRQKTRAAGFPDLHLNQVLWNMAVLPGEKAVRDPNETLQRLGFDSFTSYVWIHHVALETFPETDYWHVFRKYLEYWERIEQQVHFPYFPNATMGWDSSPRTIQSEIFQNAGYPFTPSLKDNTPQHFKEALREIRQRMDQTGGPKILTINAWNEWTEGSYLEPDTQDGFSYLEAIRDVFK